MVKYTYLDCIGLLSKKCKGCVGKGWINFRTNNLIYNMTYKQKSQRYKNIKEQIK